MSASSPISSAFAALAAQNRPGFVPYITAGFPSLDDTAVLLRGLAEAGADVIELGIPFSDPMADGPTIQWSSQQALDQGIGTGDVLQVLRDFRAESDTPVVLFSYLNPLISWGVERFIEEAIEAGADGLLPTDLPLGADPQLEHAIEDSALDLIRLVAPTTPLERVTEVSKRSQGFLYYISRTGVTGTGATLRTDLERDVAQVREHSVRPVAVGFGISTPEHATLVGRCADAAIVGSALVNAAREGGTDQALELASALRAALDTCRN